MNTFLPVAVATGTETFIGRLFFGSQPAFIVPPNLAALPNNLSAAPILLLYLPGFWIWRRRAADCATSL